MNSDLEQSPKPSVALRWIIWLSGAAALIYLMVEHRPHLFGWIPYLILLACPVTHFLMHRGHRHTR
jgi:hypothetical protein